MKLKHVTIGKKKKTEEKNLRNSRVRPSWDEYFMRIAELASTRSTCLRRQVGAVIVKDKKILATGYNGAPSGLRHCLDIGCLREKLKIPSGERHELCRATHAEQNAIVQAALFGVSIKDGIMYSTTQPCILCTKLIINAGIRKIVIKDSYPDRMSRQMLKEAKVKIHIYEDKQRVSVKGMEFQQRRMLHYSDGTKRHVCTARTSTGLLHREAPHATEPGALPNAKRIFTQHTKFQLRTTVVTHKEGSTTAAVAVGAMVVP